MNKKFSTSFAPGLILGITLICGLACFAHPGLCYENANPAAAAQQQAPPPAAYVPEYDDYPGGINVKIHPGIGKTMPSVDFVLYTPGGKTAGGIAGEAFTQYADSYAGYETVDTSMAGKSGVIDIIGAPPGEYVVRITGIEDGRYSIEFNGYGFNHEETKVEIPDSPVRKGEVKDYHFWYNISETPILTLKSK